MVDFPKPGTVLWAVDADLAVDIFRSGAATKPNVEFLRYADVGNMERDGRIPEADFEGFMVDPGNGISLFRKRLAPEGMVAASPDTWTGKGKTKIQWWGIDQKHPIPKGLSRVYDGEPPGRCTLTFDRTMTVKAFLALVALVPFSKCELDLFVPKS